MPTDRPILKAAPRELTGKAVSRLRRDGRLPAVVYGHGVPSENLSIDAHEFDMLRRHVTSNSLIDLDVDGTSGRPVLIHNVQIHPLHRRPIHVDLLAVRMTQELIVDVPLVPIGVSEAIEVQGGTLLHVMEAVRVRALPDHLPQSVQYSIEPLVDFDAAIHVRDLALPSDVTLLNDLDELVAKVERPRVEVPEARAAEEGEEAAAAAGEGEAAEGGQSAEAAPEG